MFGPGSYHLPGTNLQHRATRVRFDVPKSGSIVGCWPEIWIPGESVEAKARRRGHVTGSRTAETEVSSERWS